MPSENRLSLAARLPHLMDAAVRYAFPGPEGGSENWAWPGRQDLFDVEQAAAARLGAQLGADFVNLKPVSGVSALTVALSALVKPWTVAYNLAERDGGHGSTRFIGTRLGLQMKDLPVDPATCTLALDALDALDHRLGDGRARSWCTWTRSCACSPWTCRACGRSSAPRRRSTTTPRTPWG
ncbi:hypothetical protein [Streptomyces olivaceoviridis]|uniref:hypothetical protein n=1 Tax=Streptomyces olivaceoviridis TaxID=1921 RepID=UPI00333497B7